MEAIVFDENNILTISEIRKRKGKSIVVTEYGSFYTFTDRYRNIGKAIVQAISGDAIYTEIDK